MGTFKVVKVVTVWLPLTMDNYAPLALIDKRTLTNDQKRGHGNSNTASNYVNEPSAAAHNTFYYRAAFGKNEAWAFDTITTAHGFVGELQPLGSRHSVDLRFKIVQAVDADAVFFMRSHVLVYNDGIEVDEQQSVPVSFDNKVYT